MTPLKEIITALETASHPVVKVIHKTEQCKVIGIGFNKGVILKDHQTSIKSKLTVLSGQVVYKENLRVLNLAQYDEVEIPVNTMDSVEANEKSLCLLFQG